MAIKYPTYRFSEPFCSEGEKTVPPVTQTATGNGRTSLKTGFPPECQKPISSGGLPPERSDFNGVLNALSQWAAWQSVGGSIKYDSSLTYPEGAMVYHNKRRWMCVREATGQEPTAVSTYWQQFGELTGTVKLFASSKTPSGYLPCDGRAVLRSEYPDLFAIIGTSFGGSGGYFNVPDFRNRFPMGATSGIGQYVKAGIPNLTGNLNAISGTGGYSGVFAIAGDATAIGGGGTHYYGSQFANLDASRVSSIYGGSSTVQPPAVKIGYFIRY